MHVIRRNSIQRSNVNNLILPHVVLPGERKLHRIIALFAQAHECIILSLQDQRQYSPMGKRNVRHVFQHRNVLPHFNAEPSKASTYIVEDATAHCEVHPICTTAHAGNMLISLLNTQSPWLRVGLERGVSWVRVAVRAHYTLRHRGRRRSGTPRLECDLRHRQHRKPRWTRCSGTCISRQRPGRSQRRPPCCRLSSIGTRQGAFCPSRRCDASRLEQTSGWRRRRRLAFISSVLRNGSDAGGRICR